ncbi:lipid kinase YegS [Azotobacter beijerinckii]|uniref:Probable lipid kinase YegS-like n=1 Tax=Azotobacter beijerinckii TaxID=170623 RepID=A0A1I4EIX8_9GAMM|nr:lipid kinase YegS [Azotobacter beijerinckii]SFB49833.1 lipid kinase YegS [Azotobacter beijerinckii]SFL05685.1 lipid kinase YegS [Azotobacter beijerinckii]
MGERKAWLVLHGRQATNEELRAAVLARRKAGWEIAVRLTWEAGDARRLVEEGLAAGYPTLVAGGGDGTLREVAEAMALAGTDASLAILPLGTANDFARAAGVPLSPAEALALLEVAPSPVDLGEADGQLFLNMATGGFGSRVTASTPEELKKALGGAAYLLTGLTRFPELGASFGRFRGPGFRWEGEFLALGIGNGRQAGGGNLLCPEALVDDGLLDLCIVPAPEDAGSPLSTLGTLISLRILGVETISIGARLPWVEIEVPEGLDLNLDGEPANSQALRFSVRAGALRMHLPPDSPLLRGNAGPAIAGSR